MLKQRRYHDEIVKLQLTVRREMLRQLFHLDGTRLAPVLEQETEVAKMLSQLVEATKDTADALFFTNYQLVVRALYHLLRGAHQELHADANADTQFKAVRANLRRIQFASVRYPEPFRVQLLDFVALCTPSDNGVVEVEEVARAFCQLAFPTIYALETDPLAALKQQWTKKEANEALGPAEPPLLLAVEFLVGDEPWANPQVLRPAETYAVRGTLKPNRWPTGYDQLVLKPLSTTSGAFYDLELPEVRVLPTATQYQLTGHIAFKFPQSNVEDTMAIRLLAYYENAQGARLVPTIVGYDQLVASVLDPAFGYLPTGFQALNQAVFTIIQAIRKQLPDLDPQELGNFVRLLSGIANYQGHCLQQGVYKERDSVSEDEFRDELIRHLVGLPYIGEHVIKEGHLAGGRVEISFHGVIAELKVEKTTADRGKLLKKYGKQAAAYAAANTKRLSIVSVLDLTKKLQAPAPPQNNILLGTPDMHGFAETEPAFPARQVLVVIDGNTRKPSDYS
ncbi:MAG: hypothetical protein ACRYG7_46360 [Janthinobacterium lividum]